MPDQVPREVPVISATLIFPRYFSTRNVYPKFVEFEKNQLRHKLLPISSRLSSSSSDYLAEFRLVSVLVNYILSKVKNRIDPILRNSHCCSYANFIIVHDDNKIIHDNYPRVGEIDSWQVSKCQRDFSQPVSLALSRECNRVLGGAGVLCIYAGLNGGRVAEEVPVCGPEIKRPSANEVNGARGVPRYSRRVILDTLDVCATRWGNVDTRSRRDKEAAYSS